ncbi:MAG: GNAT family N-acetyltransferase [Candidatus Aureabacteria bacterium]|nr:GNAT family N-acetyltransferase [Candidatus Auribacterota bacterium]
MRFIKRISLIVFLFWGLIPISAAQPAGIPVQSLSPRTCLSTDAPVEILARFLSDKAEEMFAAFEQEQQLPSQLENDFNSETVRVWLLISIKNGAQGLHTAVADFIRSHETKIPRPEIFYQFAVVIWENAEAIPKDIKNRISGIEDKKLRPKIPLTGEMIPAEMRDINRIEELSQLLGETNTYTPDQLRYILENRGNEHLGALSFVFVYREADSVSAYVYAVASPKKKLVYLMHIAVDPLHQGRGIASYMQKKTSEFFREKGYTAFYAACNPRSTELAERAGFQMMPEMRYNPVVRHELKPDEEIMSLNADPKDIIAGFITHRNCAMNVHKLGDVLFSPSLPERAHFLENHFFFQWMRINQIHPTEATINLMLIQAMMAGIESTRNQQEMNNLAAGMAFYKAQFGSQKAHIRWQKEGRICPDSYNPLEDFVEAFVRFTMDKEKVLLEIQSAEGTLQERLINQARMFTYLENLFYLNASPLTDEVRQAIQRKCA